jgi:hypothetical protein
VRCRESGWARPRRWACRLPRLRQDLERQIRKAVECLIKYRDALLGFYDFPVEHWKHLRTTDEMASNFFDRDDDYGNRYTSFATVRHRDRTLQRDVSQTRLR